ncbi:hypothetical protein AT258_18800 [Bacillus wiedmannii]|uniref:hypothetical protein n=1 Tax=Bacillus TaxID=1386 RepID=UPI0001A01E26|nr:hypothetical protein [Bacillus cereus]EEK75912.1 hypothetical protein bcere0009_52190 [Bacillus cereus R309803]KXY71949.1 hypothetical protein AT258_18800 [Bacillus wiedmannii]HDR4563383.1 hypothetical protein [Bacillus luti]MBL3852746.1 hypothetical protein [Bacillus cereus]HDR4564078.1 hypothetical protein [Bacillus luti]
MTEKKRRITLNLEEREWEALERIAERNDERIGELIEGLIRMDLDIPDDLLTEEEKRDKISYTMYFEGGHPDKLMIELEAFSHCDDEENYYEKATRYFNRDEKKFEIEDDETQFARYHFRELFSFFGEEICTFSDSLKVGQMVENGVLKEDEYRPNITKEQVDRLLEQCIHLHVETGEDLDPRFFFLNTNKLEREFSSLKGIRIYCFVRDESVSKLSTSKPLTLEDMYIELAYDVKEIIGYYEIEEGKEVYPYFKKRFEEELIPQMLETREFKIYSMSKMFG